MATSLWVFAAFLALAGYVSATSIAYPPDMGCAKTTTTAKPATTKPPTTKPVTVKTTCKPGTTPKPVTTKPATTAKPVTTCKPTTKKPDCGCEEKKCTDPNEEYALHAYEEGTCDEPSRKSCTPVYACRCKKGFVRHDGKCITKCECPNRCPGANEEYVLAREGEETCDGQKPRPCLPVRECRCISGFVRHNGVCIRKTECPPQCTGANEIRIYTKFEDETCDEAAAVTCNADYYCRCRRGYVRHNGVCIRKCDCPSKCPENEEFVQAVFGEETCDRREPDPCSPVEECRCVQGYVRHNGKCIRRCDCPPKCTGLHEVYITTTLGEKTCDIREPDPCTPVTECRCEDGYVRHEGICIRECDCPPKCKGDNEEYVYTELEDATCDGPSAVNCEPKYACRCERGYVRHEGKCIKSCDCPPKCQNPNEVYIWTTREDETCDGKKPPLCEKVKACRCRRGYVRHEGKCIKLCDCPPKCSDPFEEYRWTKYEQETCDNSNPAPISLQEACRCILGYVKHEGKCIKKCECPPKCTDPNEIYVTTKFGDATCDGDGPELSDEVTACRCRRGFVRHEGKCIDSCDCPPKCLLDFEEYITTTESERTCANLIPSPIDQVTECRCVEGYVRHEGKCIRACDCPSPCSKDEELVRTRRGELTCNGRAPDLEKVTLVCRCKWGLVRHEGKCIKSCDCPPKCTGQYEKYIVNTNVAEKTCDEDDPPLCTPVSECRCIDGYVRHNGICIKDCDCPPKCPGPNEKFVGTKLTDPTCDSPSVSCRYVKACRCLPGFVRHENKCIKPCDCPSVCKDPNEEFVTAITGERTCGDPTPAPCRPVKECRCIEGFVRHNGACIKPSECPCGDNEIYSDCAPLIQETCDNQGPPCKKGCRPGCMCKPGYVRNCDNKCIKRCMC